MNLNKKDTVIHELYVILERLHYPEVAQISYENFENNILTGTKRIDLFHWLLQESPGFNSLSFNKFKDNLPLQDKLFICYSQMGLCNDENIFLGKCEFDKQLHFFTSLTHFVKTIYLFGAALKNNDDQISNDVLNTKAITSNINSQISTDQVKKTESISNSNLSNYSSNKELTEEIISEKLCWDVKENIKDIPKPQIENYELTLQKFNTSFEEVIAMPTENLQDIFTKFYNNISIDLQSMHSAFTTINKTLINEAKIQNNPIQETCTSTVKPLTPAISANLVLVEQVHNMFNDIQNEKN